MFSASIGIPPPITRRISSAGIQPMKNKNSNNGTLDARHANPYFPRPKRTHDTTMTIVMINVIVAMKPPASPGLEIKLAKPDAKLATKNAVTIAANCDRISHATAPYLPLTIRTPRVRFGSIAVARSLTVKYVGVDPKKEPATLRADPSFR